MAQIFIIGAGLSGLAAAVSLAPFGHKIALYEASAQAGGRCRSYFDSQLDCEIDNGNHLILSANEAVLAYLATLGARDSLVGPDQAIFPFVDLATGERWEVRPSAGRIPWWILDRRQRIPGTRPWDYVRSAPLALANSTARVADCVTPQGLLWSRFWKPLTVAALNTDPVHASAQLLWRVVRETFLRGEAHCRPMIAKDSLGQSLVQPALAFLARWGTQIFFNQRLKGLKFDDSHVTRLDFQASSLQVEENDHVIVALPPWISGSLIPDLTVPQGNHAIVNAHFRFPEDIAATIRQTQPASILGLVGGTADWLFLRGDIVSLTVSAADHLIDQPNEQLLQRLWHDTAGALRLDPEQAPKMRLIKEKRATFSQTPENLERRPNAKTRWRNLLLAGDWTDTGYPATIESAIRSGNNAAALIPG